MPATKILWGQIIAVFFIVLTAIWSATQWTATALAYQPELGEPWFVALGWPVYPPYAFFWWWFSFDAYAPDIFQTDDSKFVPATPAVFCAVACVYPDGNAEQ